MSVVVMMMWRRRFFKGEGLSGPYDVRAFSISRIRSSLFAFEICLP